MSAETMLYVPENKMNSSDIKSILNSGKAADNPQDDLSWYFPELDPGIDPYGDRVLVQLRRVRTKTAGGISLPAETIAVEKWNTQTAKMVRHGPLAYRNNQTLEKWPEGIWANIGDYVRVPRWGGDKIEVDIGSDGETIVFCIFKASEVLGKVLGDPRKIKNFVL